MLALLADENFHGPILEGLREQYPEIDLVSVQEAGLRASPDEVILQWAADHAPVLLGDLWYAGRPGESGSIHQSLRGLGNA